MKRKVTELEQKLLDKGFRLSYKTYGGKHSQYVDEYHYLGEQNFYDEELDINTSVLVKVILNSKKDKILAIFIVNPLNNFEFISKEELQYFLIIATHFENEIRRL